MHAYAKGDAKAADTDVRGIMEEMAKDISFGLDHLDAVRRERATQDFNEALLNNLAAGISIVRFPDQVIERVNARMLEIYGASSVEDLVGYFAGKKLSIMKAAQAWPHSRRKCSLRAMGR